MKNIPIKKKTCAKALRQEKTWYSWDGKIVIMGRVQRALSSGRGSGREKSEMKKRRRRKREGEEGESLVCTVSYEPGSVLSILHS